MLLSHFWKFLSGILHILEYTIYSSCSRPHFALGFLYTKPEIFFSSLLFCSLSNFSSALSFAYLLCQRCLRGRCLPFVALFNKSVLNKEILLLSSKQSASVPGHISLWQICTALYLAHWFTLLNLLPLKGTWGRECLYVQGKPYIPWYHLLPL